MRTRRKIGIGLSILLLTILLAYNTISTQNRSATLTPIQHLVIIFQENSSFDHYFGTYPFASNPPGEPSFNASNGTPAINGLSGGLLTNNPNVINPFRLDRSQAVTCDMDHDYMAEQKAYDGGLLDKFVKYTGATGKSCMPNQVMGYYDGNTVTALWEYAQNFALSDNSFETTFGPSTPGALNLISGQTHGANPANLTNITVNGTIIGDVDPAYDDCSGSPAVSMSGSNIGDLLNAKGITWGWFESGFTPTNYTSTNKAICNSRHKNIANVTVVDYSPHHEPFQYYLSTANPHHLPPSSLTMIGKSDQANHQYDLSLFWVAVDSGNLPAVSFLKAAKYQDGHPGYSDPLDEQKFIVTTINHLEDSSSWRSTAIIIAYDDSDGWYDHVMPPILSQSDDPNYDTLLGAGLCGTTPPGAYSGRCGYGPRLPFLIISPYAKRNFVDHTLTDQTSILKFIEDNWNLGRIGSQSFDALSGTLLNIFDFTNEGTTDSLYLDPSSGLPTA